MKRLTFIFIFVGLLAGVSSIVLVNSTYTESHDIYNMRADLSELDDRYTELKSEYLRLALEELGPQARAEGFVALESPRYIHYDTAVGFAR